jgi:hypothetical protein
VALAQLAGHARGLLARGLVPAAALGVYLTG